MCLWDLILPGHVSYLCSNPSLNCPVRALHKKGEMEQEEHGPGEVRAERCTHILQPPGAFPTQLRVWCMCNDVCKSSLHSLDTKPVCTKPVPSPPKLEDLIVLAASVFMGLLRQICPKESPGPTPLLPDCAPSAFHRETEGCRAITIALLPLRRPWHRGNPLVMPTCFAAQSCAHAVLDLAWKLMLFFDFCVVFKIPITIKAFLKITVKTNVFAIPPKNTPCAVPCHLSLKGLPHWF